MNSSPFPLRPFRALVLLSVLALLSPSWTSAKSNETPVPTVGNLGDLRALETQVVSLADKAVQATVAIVSPGGGSTGSGVVVSEEGLVLTAAHVIQGKNTALVVIFPDGTRYKAKALGADFDRDAGMVKIVEEGSFPHVEVGPAEAPPKNQWLVALGHPGGFDPDRPPPVRLGRILRSGLFTVTDCAVISGDSGGPLLDVDGRVVGIHSSIGASLSENRHVPVSAYLENWERMASGERWGTRFAMRQDRPNPNRPVLGVILGQGETDPPGALVEGVIEGSPADKAGIRIGDLIIKAGETDVSDASSLVQTVGKRRPGQTIDLSILRDGEELNFEPKLVRSRALADAEVRRNPTEPDDAAATAETIDEWLDERVEEAMETGRLRLNPEALRRFGDREALAAKLREKLASLTPEQKERLREAQEAALRDPFFDSAMNVLSDVVAEASAATVAVLSDDEPVALGTVVSREGWILTKDVETREGIIAVRSGGKNVPLTLIERFPDHDLALYDSGREWPAALVLSAGRDEVLPLGRVLAAAGPDGKALGIGLVSVLPRALPNPGFLGIQMASRDAGVGVVRTIDGSAAAKAGLQRGDLILRLDDEPVADRMEFATRIRNFGIGAEVSLGIRRGEEDLELRVKLGERPGTGSPRFDRINRMSGPMSQRQKGFPNALQHDIPLPPTLCGGPLVDLNGRCIGINVSRAGRIKTLAIPAANILELLESAQKPDPESGA